LSRHPANQKTAERGTPTVAELANQFMADYVRAKRKAGTAEFYRDILDRIVKPAMGTTKADKLTRLQVGRLHSSLAMFAGRSALPWFDAGNACQKLLDQARSSRSNRQEVGQIDGSSWLDSVRARSPNSCPANDFQLTKFWSHV
jgi:hypothetical protein